MLVVVVKLLILAVRTTQKFLKDRCTQMAAAVSFSIFPLALAATSIFGFVIRSQDLETELIDAVGNLIPVSSDFITSAIRGVIETRAATGIIGTLGLIWSATAVFNAIKRALNIAWGMIEPRPFIQDKLVDFSMMAGGGVFLLLSLSATAGIRVVRELSTRQLSSLGLPTSILNGDLLWHSITMVVPGLFTFLTFMLLYHFVPNTRVRFKDIWLGALLGAIGFEITKNVFAWYVVSFASYSVVYGTLGKLVAFMMWVYISAATLLYGAELAAEYPRVMGLKEAEVTIWGMPLVRGKGGILPALMPPSFRLELEALRSKGYNAFKRVCQKTSLRRQ
jgi:membrane protein